MQAIEENQLESRKHWILWIFRQAGQNNGKNSTYQFWQQGNHPVQLVSNAFINEKLHYVHNNPVAAGLVSYPEAYCYSSAADYAGEKGMLTVEVL